MHRNFQEKYLAGHKGHSMVYEHYKHYEHYARYLMDLIVENKFKKFVEIGLWQCVMMKKILKIGLDDYVDEYWGIDNFNHNESGYHRKLTKKIWNGAYFKACSYMTFYSSVKILRMKSSDASKLFRKGDLDMVFIDASHDYDSVVEDIKCWEPLIRKGGIISGHDYTRKKWGVNKAVNDIYKDREIKELPGTIWYVEL